MFCMKCGAQYEGSGEFCTSCGAPVDVVRVQTEPVTPTSNINEFFSYGTRQPPESKPFGVVDNAVIYGEESILFERIDYIKKAFGSTRLTNGVYQMKTNGRWLNLVYKHKDRERALNAIGYAQCRVAEAKALEAKALEIKAGLLHDLKGNRGRTMQVYEDRVVLKVKASFGSFLMGNITDGEKIIYFSDCIAVQFREQGKLLIGYLQFETAGSIMNNSTDNFSNENTFTWDSRTQTNEFMRKIATYVNERIKFYKQIRNTPATVAFSVADELKKFKELLDAGIISYEEFEKKKSQLMDL